MKRSAIESEVLRWMRTEPEREDEERFDRLARALFAWQFEHCPPYGRFCSGRGVTPASVEGWRQIPAVPTGAFKELPLRCFDAAATVKTFRTSGTTDSAAYRGELHLDTLELYEASLVPSFERGLLADLPADARIPMLILAPSASAAPDSSLSHMFEVMHRLRGAPQGGFFIEEGRLSTGPLLRAAESARGPVLLCGTAFAFVHWLEDLDARGVALRLPEGTRVMETGGFKGRARERSREALHREIGDRLGIPTEKIINQYGMTELGSQFYDVSLCRPGSSHKRIPSWVRVRIVDPVSGAEVPDGEIGMIEVVDLANTGSVAAIQTADLGRRIEGGFVVIGRDAEAEERGCSIAADEMLGAGV